MGQAVDVGDAAGDLKQARADADQAVKDVGIGSLDVTRLPAGESPPPLPRRGRTAPLTDPGALAEVQPAQPADADSIPHGDLTPAAPPPPPDEKLAEVKPGVFDQAGSEVSNGVMRGFAELGRAAALATSAPAILIDKIHSLASGKRETGAQDAIFKVIDDYANTAVDYWKPEDQSKSGVGAQVLGDVAGVLPALATGPAALPALTTKAVSDAGIESVRAGQDAKTAAILATVAGVSNVLGMKIPLKSPNIWKRIATSIGGNLAINAATQTLTKEILDSNGFKDAASKIDLTDPRSLLSTIAIAIGFGLHRQAGATPKQADKAAQDGTKVGQPPAPDPDAAAAPAPPPGPAASDSAAPPPPPPGPNDVTTPPPGGTPINVPDQPSVEPAKDLRAQVRDMNDPKTPRVGVLVAKDSVTSLAGSKDANALSVLGTLNQARSQDRVVQLPQGELMLKTKKIADVTRDRLAKGEDPQAVIGSVTGAGDGKQPDATAVVQGKDANGNVTSETMVHPDNVEQAKRDIEAQGKTVEVTTPEAAVQRRVDEISRERNTPTQLGIMTHPDGREVAVHVEPGAPDGMVRVRPLDAEGEPTDKTIDVAKDRVKMGAPNKTEAPVTAEQRPVEQRPTGAKPADSSVEKAAKEAAITPSETKTPPTSEVGVETPKPDTASESVVKTEAAPPSVKTASEDTAPSQPSPAPKVTVKAKKIQTGLEALPAALEAHEKQEVPQPGRKFVAVPERQENASTFAAVLKAAADTARGKVEPAAIERAVKAAKAAERLSEKGKEETAKGQGTGHTFLDAVVAEMHKAARGLLGTARPGDETVVKPKEAQLLAKKARDEARVKKAAGIEPDKNEDTAKPKRVRKPLKAKSAEPAEEPTTQAATSKAQVERETQRLADRFIHAEEEDLPQARKDIEAHLKQHYGDTYTPDQTRDILHLLMERRLDENPNAEQTGPRRLADDPEIDDEEHVAETLSKDLERLGMRNVGKHALQFAMNKLDALKNAAFNNKMATQYHNLAVKMAKDGHFSELLDSHNTGRGISSHSMLDRMIASAEGPELKSLLQNLRAKVPDLPIYSVSDIKNLRTGEGFKVPASGLFDGTHNAIQVRPNRVPVMTIKTLVHEMVHAATFYELHNNPGGYFAQALDNAHRILLKRFVAMYGKQHIADHWAYFNGTGEQPANYDRSLYGIANKDELLSELHVNHEFVQKIADSEAFAQPDEKLDDVFLGGGKTLLHRIYGAIGRLLGVREPRLLQHIAGLADKTMDAQVRQSRQGGRLDYLGNNKAEDFDRQLVTAMREKFNANPLEISRALPSFEELAHEPGPLRGVEDKLRASFGDDETAAEPTRIARLFKQAMNSGAVDGIRAIKTALKTVPQIYRDHRRDFGDRNDPANPLVQLQDIDRQKTAMIRDMSSLSRDVVRRWMRVSDEDNKVIGTTVRDWTMNKVDPRKDFGAQVKEVKDDPNGEARYNEFASQWSRLQKTNPEAAQLVSDVFDVNRKLARAERRANIDTALEAFSESPINDAQRTLLYAARTPEAFEEAVGPGKLIDVGENNDKLKAALKDFAGKTELEGPYAHLGRHGDYVVTASPEGTKKFRSESEARQFAQQVNDLSPNSKGEYVFREGQHQVDYKVQYTSFHDTRNQALEERERMAKAGYDVGLVTRKTMSREDTPLSAGARDLSAAVEAKINRTGKSPANDALVAALRSAMLHLAASRSAYAGSKLARKNFAGVKPEEMRRSFADHTQSTIWHTAQLRTTFKQAAALSKLRNMARDDSGADQATMFRRGQAVDALNKHLQDEVQNFGHKSPTNAAIARLGFMSYLASPSHAFIWMTQNFTTGIPVAGARWGYARAATTFLHAMTSVFSPAMRDAIHESFAKGGATKDANEAMMSVLKDHDRWGKWAPQIQSMINDGVLGHGYGNELHEMAQATGSGARYINRAFDVARMLPAMADSFNRVSTALTALELTGGDVRKASDFVDEVHADYSAQAKPLAFKKIGRVPGANSITMFKTYTQSMIHLFYGNIKAAIEGSGEGGRAEAAKTVAGMVIANALFAGVYGAAAIEPLKLAVYGYHKLFDKEGEVFDLKNSIHNWLVDHMGHTAGNAAAGGLPHLAGFDLSSRMGLTDLFFHDPPDLFSADKEGWKNFAYAQGGPMLDFLASRTSEFISHMQRGQGFQAVSSLVPVKAYQDAVKAFELGTTGKTNSIGRQMTKPSKGDAVYQALGLKPSSVADAQEASGTKINYNTQVKATKNSILKAWAAASSGSEKIKAQARINAFNRMHPAEAIKPNEQRAMMKYQQETQANQPGKDQELNNMLRYTRK